MRVCKSNVAGTCGLAVWHSFENDWYNWDYIHALQSAPMGGIGFTVAGFVQTKRCKRVFEWIKENKEIVYQSPVKKNRNSGRQFFFIVFKNKE